MLAALLGANAVYVVAEPVDLRRSIDGLALAVKSILGASPLSGAVFVFFNHGGDKVKLLWWDRHGFWLAYKRLEGGRFRLSLTLRFPGRNYCCCWKAWIAGGEGGQQDREQTNEGKFALGVRRTAASNSGE